jgi:ammonia channel protein AmtB
VVIPELIYVAFQATFAAITVCLIVGAFAERIKFSAVLLFAVIWFTFSYLPIAHMVWFWPGPDAFTDAKAASSRPRRRAGCSRWAHSTSQAALLSTSTPVSPAWWVRT